MLRLVDARLAFVREKTDLAIELSAVLVNDPGVKPGVRAWAQLNRAAAYGQRGDTDGAIADLTEVINRRFYGERISFMPWAGTFLGYKALNAHHLPTASGAPDPSSGLVETTPTEVAKVIELVLAHAQKRPRESLMVITASIKHAVAIDQAIMDEMARRSDFAAWMSRDTAEPLTVLTLDQASAESRDRIIFSLGYGRTPHGRLLSEFGSLSRFGGERLLAVAMTRARRSISN